MARIHRYKKRTSDRSGFDYREIEMVKEGGLWLGPDERDEPPPSRKPLGGEGEISQGGPYYRTSTDIFTLDVDRENPTNYISAAGGITPNFTHPYMRVVGSNAAVTITANPAIAVGRQGQVLTLYGVGSTITIENGNGVATMASAPMALNSGATITFIFNSGNTAWQETSRDNGIGIGG